MVTGVIKTKIDKIWTDIWAGGITNPLTVIEQLTYLMFIRSLDEKELEAEEFANLTGETADLIFPQSEIGQAMRWSKFKDRDAREIFDLISQRVFPAIKKMKYGRLPDFDEKGELIEIPDREDGQPMQTAFTRYMESAVFVIPSPQILEKIITGLEDLYEHDIADLDMQGDLYEYMLGKLSTAGQNGQFRTPKHIREMMVDLTTPTPDDLICDPACGTAGFLVSAAEYIRRNFEDTMTDQQWTSFGTRMFSGYDTDQTMLRISAMNLMLHSITNPDITYKDSVSKQNNVTSKYTVCLANPPFKGTVDAESIHDNLKAVTNTKKTELLFLALFLRLLQKGGRCACIVPDGVLFGSSKAHKSIRRELIENHQLKAVISMPSGVFKPYAGVSTAILVFIKTDAGGTENVWFYDMKADGFSLDDKRTAVSENDIPDIIARFRNLDGEADRERTEQSFLVPKSEIVENGYDLSINKYKKTEYVAVEYPPTSEILAEIRELQNLVDRSYGDLAALIKSPFDGVQKELVKFKSPFDGMQNELFKSESPFIDIKSFLNDKWWAVVLETETANEWNTINSASLKQRMDGDYGIEYIKKYLVSKINNYKVSEAVKCYDLCVYYPCACSLATLIEDRLSAYGIQTSTNLKKMFKTFLEQNQSLMYVVYAIERFYNNYTANTEGTMFAFDKQEPSFLNRHWLLHGRMKRPISEFDCLQLLCALYAIVAMGNGDLK